MPDTPKGRDRTTPVYLRTLPSGRLEIVEKLMYDYDDEWLDRLDPSVLGV